GSRAANPYGAPRKHAALHSRAGTDRKAPDLAIQDLAPIRRAGFPATVAPAATSRVTTLPAPITAPSPIVTPGMMSAPPPIQTSAPIRTGRPNSSPSRRVLASR